MKLTSIIACLICCAVGCESVHTPRADGVPVAFWPSTILVNQQGQAVRPPVRNTVARVLSDAGIDATVDNTGISVPESQERRAREILLTDPRLAETDVIVVLMVPAGKGRKVAGGFEVPEVAPDEPMRVPEAPDARD